MSWLITRSDSSFVRVQTVSLDWLGVGVGTWQTTSLSVRETGAHTPSPSSILKSTIWLPRKKCSPYTYKYHDTRQRLFQALTCVFSPISQNTKSPNFIWRNHKVTQNAFVWNKIIEKFNYLEINSVYSRFPDSYFPEWFFPERRFPGGHFPGWDNFLWLIYRRTSNMNNTLYIFIPRRKVNWLALLTPQGYAKCQMLIFHHSSKTNELYETSKVRLKLHLFPLSYPGLVL